MTDTDRGPIVIVGSGDHGRVVLALLRAAGEAPLGFVDPKRGDVPLDRLVDGLRVVGDLEEELAWRATATRFVAAVGDNLIRAGAFERCLALRLTPATAVHPTALLLEGARVEPGAVVCAGAVIGVAAWVGPDAIVNTAATVDHDDRIGPHATVGPGAHLAGRVQLGEGAFVGIGAAVREGCRIGAWAMVAGGAMVVADIPDGERVAGVPARVMRGSGAQ